MTTDEIKRAPRRLPSVGAFVVDTARDRVGEFRAELRGKYYLRPIGGGREWAVSPDCTRSATQAEQRRAVRESKGRRG